MKNLRKVLAFTLALAMLLGTMITTFAANEKVQALETLKLVDVQTKEGLANDLTRAVGLATVLKAKGYTQDDANAKAADVKFTDVTKEWQKGWTVLGQEAGIIEGTGEGKFNPEGKLSKKDFTRMMLRTLGYSVEETRGDLADLVAKTALVESLEDDKFTKEEALEVMFDALKVKVKEGDMTLAQKLVKDGRFTREQGQEVGVCQAQPDKLMVESVVADNLKEVVVTFNGTVDKDTAEKTANYRVKGATVNAVEVKEDKMTVVLTVSGKLNNQREYELTVSEVKNEAGVVMEKQVVTFRTNDVTIPEKTEVTVTGPKNFTVKFSEPLEVQPTVLIQSGKSTYAATPAGFVAGAREVQYTSYTNFQEGKDYVLHFGDNKGAGYATDFAGYKSTQDTYAFTYTKDTTAPEVKVVSANSKEVVLEFTKPIKAINVNHISHSYSVIKAKSVTADAKYPNRYKAVFYTASGDNALPTGTVKVYVYGKVGNTKIEDNWGNVLADTVLEVQITEDREAPVVSSIETKADGKTVEVTFNEELFPTSVVTAVLSKDGKEEAKETGVVNKKKVTFTFKKDFTGKTFSLLLTGAKDDSLFQNLMAPHSEDITFSDKVLKALTATKVEFYKIDNSRRVLYLTFPEEMGDSALDSKNYQFNDGTENRTLDGSFSFLEGNRSVVVVELSYNQTTPAGTDVNFLTNNNDNTLKGVTVTFARTLTDLAGNGRDTFAAPESAVVSSLNTTAFTVKKATAVARNRVEVEFSDIISDFDGVAFVGNTTTNDNYFIAGHSIAQVSKKSDKVLELTLAEESLPTSAALNLQIKVATGATNTPVLDIMGRRVQAATVQLGDKIAPSIAALVEATDSSADAYTEQDMYTNLKSKKGNADYKGKPAILVKSFERLGTNNANAVLGFKFSEAVSVNSFSTSTFDLSEGWRVTGVKSSANGQEIELNIAKENGKFAELQKLTFTQKSAFKDIAGNNSDIASGAMDTLCAAAPTTLEVSVAEQVTTGAAANLGNNDDNNAIVYDQAKANGSAPKLVFATQTVEKAAQVKEVVEVRMKLSAEVKADSVDTATFTVGAVAASVTHVAVNGAEIVLTITADAVNTDIDLATMTLTQAKVIKSIHGDVEMAAAAADVVAGQMLQK